MKRGTQAFWTALAAAAGLGAGLVAGRVATMGMADKNGSARAYIVLSTSIVGASTAAGITSYATTPKLLTA